MGYEWENSRAGTLMLWNPSEFVSLVMVIDSESGLWSWIAWGNGLCLYKREGFLTAIQAQAQAINKLRREGLIE